MDIEELNNAKEIKKWLQSFHRLMKKCPSNLWFFSTGELNIMVTDKNGDCIYRKDIGGVNEKYCIDDESGHVWEGGDW